MLLYHYAKQRFNFLETVEFRKTITPSERLEEEKASFVEFKKTGLRRPGYYFQHISFFFEPPPLKEMSSIFGHPNNVWFKDSELTEHVLECRDIKDFKYHVVESPEKTALYYNTRIIDSHYYAKLKLAIEQNGYIGSGCDELERCSMKFIGKTAQAFRDIPKRNNYEEIKLKYAATVPHVMLYPLLGRVKVKTTRQVTIG